MKSRKQTLLFLTLLASLLIGAFVTNALSAPKELKLKVKWNPVTYTLGDPPPDPWNAELYFVPPRPLDEIDPSTILLEGMYASESAPYMSPTKPRLVVPFDGADVLTALLTKAPHLAPGEYRIWLEITGQLDDGTPFRGKGGINLEVP